MSAVRNSKRTNNLELYTYESTGVDIDRADNLVDFISERASQTKRIGNASGIGGFGALFDLAREPFKDPLLVTSTDGVGTKLRLAIDTGIHNTIGVDLVAMCVNDILVHGATPLFFLDYFATGLLSLPDAKQILGGIVDGCKQAQCALIGGETAQMPGMYKGGDYDLAGFVVGAVEREKVLPRKEIRAGATLIGLKSSGLHSNGFSLVRKFLDDRSINLSSACPYDRSYTSLGHALLQPTKIYVQSVLQSLQVEGVVAMAHITGGGITENLPRVLPMNTQAIIDPSSWEHDRPRVYDWLLENGLCMDPNEFYRVFNAGIGMILVVEPSRADRVCSVLRETGETVYVIGQIQHADGAPSVQFV
jgi:phosphoribosylformylglycinamidine cyclo-ligase